MLYFRQIIIINIITNLKNLFIMSPSSILCTMFWVTAIVMAIVVFIMMMLAFEECTALTKRKRFMHLIAANFSLMLYMVLTMFTFMGGTISVNDYMTNLGISVLVYVFTGILFTHVVKKMDKNLM